MSETTSFEGLTPILSADGKPMMTSAWSNAIRVGNEISVEQTYPDLDGMKFMMVVPNDYYRKKLMNLGPGYISTALRRCNVDVSMTDCSIYGYDDIELAKIFIESGAKIFGIGSLYPMFREVERLCNIIRAVVPNAVIILGGSMPSPIPEFALRQTGSDIACIGEAELTMISLMRVFAGEKNLEEVKGIGYIKDGEYFDNGKPELPRRVTKAEVGWPDRDVYPLERYITANKFYPFEQSDRLLTLVTGRGCPYACNFCFRSSAYRIRPVDDLLDEMEYLIDRYKLDGFYIVDDLLMLSERKIIDFCEGIINRGIKIKYNCTGRVNTVTPDIIKLLKESGCIAIYYGFESGNETVLQTMSKKTDLAQIHEAVRLTREAGIFLEFGVMFGQPGENEETLQDSVKLVKDISYDEFRTQKIFGCVPFPGTALYDWCKQNGHIKDDKDFYDRYIMQDWSLDQLPVNMTDIPDGKVDKLFHKANSDLNSFYAEAMPESWIKYFGGNIEEFRNQKSKVSPLRHLSDFTEASGSTFDTSGRS